MQVRKALVLLAASAALGVLIALTMVAARSGGDGTYTFRGHQPGDPSTPVTFSSCKPILVEINFDGVHRPEVMKRLILSAMGEVSAASGLQLQYVGPTTRRPRWPDHTLTLEGGAWPVLVAFADADELPRIHGNAGLGGGTPMTDGTVYSLATGNVALNREVFNGLHDRYQGLAHGRATVMHELGHVLGLGHVRDGGEVMNENGHGTTELGPGDRRGLAALGKGPCT